MSLSAEMPANYEMMVSHGPSVVYSHSPPNAFLADYSNGDYSFFDQPVRSCRPQCLTPPQSRRKFQPMKNEMTSEKRNQKIPKKSCLVTRTNIDETDSDVVDSTETQINRLKKKVIFADDKGYSLTQVRYVSEPSNVPPYWTLKFLTQITQGLVSPHPTDQWNIDFKQPASDYLEFRKKIDTNNVSLENVILKDNESIVVGTVKVKNIDFEKKVFVRATFDDWKSQQDIDCTYSEIYGPSSAYVLYDTFAFKIPLPPASKKLEFCICFKTRDQEFWDNNEKQNYTISKKSNKPEDLQFYENSLNTSPNPSDNTTLNNSSEPIEIAKKTIFESYKTEALTWSGFSHWNNPSPYW